VVAKSSVFDLQQSTAQDDAMNQTTAYWGCCGNKKPWHKEGCQDSRRVADEAAWKLGDEPLPKPEMTTTQELIERLHWEADNKGLPPFDGWGWLHQAAAELTRLRAEDAYNTDIIARLADKLTAAEASEAEARAKIAEQLIEIARLTGRISPDAKAIANSLRQWSDEDVRIATGQLPPLEHRQKTMGYIAARYIEALWMNFEKAEAERDALRQVIQQ
jgi:hypothetical protein